MFREIVDELPRRDACERMIWVKDVLERSEGELSHECLYRSNTFRLILRERFQLCVYSVKQGSQ